MLKLIGDGTLAVFRADDPAEACRCALRAEENLRAAGRGGRANKHLVHAEAARIILQDWLDHAKHAA